MKNMKLIIIPMVGLFLTLISVYNCGANEKQSSQLLPLLALGLLADGNLEGQVCDIDSDCASGLFCGDAYNLDTPYTYNLCTAIPPISGTITGNGTGLSATLATSLQSLIFRLRSTHQANMFFQHLRKSLMLRL